MANQLPRIIPKGVVMDQSTDDGGINVYFEISADRENIVNHTLKQLSDVLMDNTETLKLPLR